MGNSIELVEIIPYESRISGRSSGRQYKAIVWYQDIKINPFLNQGVLNKIIKSIHSKRLVQTITNPDSLLYWQYPSDVDGRGLEPMVIIDCRSRPYKLCTTKGTVKHFGIEKCERQAATVLKILKDYHMANFRRVTVSTFRLGRTPEEQSRVFAEFQKRVNRKGRNKQNG